MLTSQQTPVQQSKLLCWQGYALRNRYISRLKSGGCRGQAMVESVFVILLACLCFFGVFQFAHLFSAKALMEHAAARAARSRTVGFNKFMVNKSARVASIPVSGARTIPGPVGVSPEIAAALRNMRVGELWEAAMRSRAYSPGIQLEVNRVPDYMGSINYPRGEQILDYELWPTLQVDIEEAGGWGGENASALTVTVRQRIPLLLSLSPLAEGEVRGAMEHERFGLSGVYSIESHYPLYLEDMNW